MTAISKRLEAQYPEDNTDWGALVVPLHEDLFGVGAHDPATFGAVALIVVLVALGSMLLPAYRATRVDRNLTLRSE